MKNIRSTGLKLFLPTIIALSLSACGGGGSGGAENAAPPAAPTLTFTDPQSTWDLANYTQTGSCALQIGDTDNGDPSLLADEASGVTYNKDTDSLFVVGDGGTAVVQVNKNITGANCATIDSMTLNDGDFEDTEGITAGGGKFVLVEERLRQVDQFSYMAGSTLKRADVQTVVLGSGVTNVGIEGITFDPKTNGYIAVRQSQPTSIFQAVIDFSAHTATGSDSSSITVATDNPPFLFDDAKTKTGLSAFNDIFALSNIVPTNAPDYGDVMIIGATDGKIVKMDRTGKLLSSLAMNTTAQNEGMTMAPDGTIYVVGEQEAGASLPGMTVFTPTTSSSNVGVGSNLYLTFDQAVTAGSGDIVISNGASDTRTISVTDKSQVTFNGKAVKIDPKVFLHPSTTYSITYAAGAIRGVSANAAAVSGTSALSFTTVSGTADTTAPTLNNTAPVNSAAGISGSHFTLFFDKAVQAGTGNIVITNTGDPSDTRTVSITDKTQVKFNGGRVTVTLTTPLKDSASYSVQIDNGVVTDLSGNAATGIASGTLSFTTAAAGAPAPTILISEVNSNANDGFDFFELYNYGDAPVDLTGWKWGDGHGDVNDPNNTAAFAVGKTIQPHERLVIVSDTAAHLVTFLSDWGLTAGDGFISMLDVNDDPDNPIGLGKADAVVVYDANGNVVSAFNYGPVLQAVIGSGEYITIPRAKGIVTTADDEEHTGPSVGGAKTTSAVWDGGSTTEPNYVAAVAGSLGGFLDVAGKSIGSPGQ